MVRLHISGYAGSGLPTTVNKVRQVEDCSFSSNLNLIICTTVTVHIRHNKSYCLVGRSGCNIDGTTGNLCSYSVPPQKTESRSPSTTPTYFCKTTCEDGIQGTQPALRFGPPSDTVNQQCHHLLCVTVKRVSCLRSETLTDCDAVRHAMSQFTWHRGMRPVLHILLQRCACCRYRARHVERTEETRNTDCKYRRKIPLT